MALAAAWNIGAEPYQPDLALSEEALHIARELDDAVLISHALDAVANAARTDGRMKELARCTRERLGLLDRLPRHDPSAAAEIADLFYMGATAAAAAGELPDAIAAARAARADTIDQGLPHFGASYLVVPLALQGEFDEALSVAAIMRESWERSGRVPLGWMAASFFSVALVHGLRGDTGAYDEWWQLAEEHAARTKAHTFGFYVAPRVAMYRGDLDRAAMWCAMDDHPRRGFYVSYPPAIRVEVAVATGAPEADQMLLEAQPLAAQNDFVDAMLTRAAGRLHRDDAELERAVTLWEAIGVRFERACTLLLLPARADEGRAELAALGCPPPAPESYSRPSTRA
jgi:hypothetical protein